MAIRVFFYSSVTNVIVLDLYCDSLVVKREFSIVLQRSICIYRSVGVVNLYENCLIGMVLDHLHYYLYSVFYSQYFVLKSI